MKHPHKHLPFALPVVLLAWLSIVSLSQAADPPAMGPHGGRLLQAANIEVELKLVDQGDRAHMQAWLYANEQPLPGEAMELNVALERLGGRVDQLTFTPHIQSLRSEQGIAEPHSFEVSVRAKHAGQTYQWRYTSFEGRVLIDPATAQNSGIETALAGPATLRHTLSLSGHVRPRVDGEARVAAHYAGTIQAVLVKPGETVRKGQVLARIQSLDSLQSYTLRAPLEGRLVQHQARAGEVVNSDRTLFVITDLERLWAELAILPADLPRLRPGLQVTLRGLNGRRQTQGHIQTILPGRQPGGIHHALVELINADSQWHLNEFVDATVDLEQQPVAVAVRREALQEFRNASVVFVHFGQAYEARMLELGAQDAQWAEVLSGLEPGTPYVTRNSYLIKADIEKSGAAHDH